MSDDAVDGDGVDGNGVDERTADGGAMDRSATDGVEPVGDRRDLLPFEDLVAPEPLAADPPAVARFAAFGLILLGGALGALVGYGVGDVMYRDQTWAAVGALLGAITGAGRGRCGGQPHPQGHGGMAGGGAPGGPAPRVGGSGTGSGPGGAE